MTTRAELESVSKRVAGIIDETDDYYWVRVLDSFNMYVMKNDKSVTPCLVKDGFWESWISAYLINRIGPGTVFFDVGANSGYYSLLAYYYGALVSNFEPNPAYFNMFEETLKRLDLGGTGMLRRNNYALSDKEGTATLYVPRELHGSASLSEMDEKWDVTPIEVKTRPLNHLNGCGNYLIKIDAEGAEEKIWDGMIESLSKRRGNNEVLLEYTPGAYSDKFLDKLEAFAPLRWIDGDARAVEISRDWLLRQNDWVMLSLRSSW